MDSIKTKSNNYALVEGKAIAGVVLVPEDRSFIIYVAWEWENQAKKKFFAITKRKVHSLLDDLHGIIDRSADYGDDVTHHPEAQKLFPLLF